MVKRNIYLEQLEKLRGTNLIKVVTGVRRCGKSTLFDLFEERLLAGGVPKSCIIRMNFELLAFDHIKDYRDLAAYLDAHLARKNGVYIFLDEVQQVEHWERTVTSLHAERKADIYITGSNAFFLSSELATLLSGRFVEIKMLPFSFTEYCIGRKREAVTKSKLFQDYMVYGGFPGLSEMSNDENLIKSYLAGVFNTVLMKDVVSRAAIRDPDLLERIMRFAGANIGFPLSSKKIADYLTSAGRKVSHETVDSYLVMLEKAFLLYKCRRYDIKGKELLKNQGKYYLVDLGLRFFSMGRKDADLGAVLENIVYLELLRRGYEVWTGRLSKSDYEVDFVASKDGAMTYYQVTWTMANKETAERELRALRSIKDNYEKIIISNDQTPFTDYEGIRQVNVMKFLLGTR